MALRSVLTFVRTTTTNNRFLQRYNTFVGRCRSIVIEQKRHMELLLALGATASVYITGGPRQSYDREMRRDDDGETYRSD